MIYNPGLDLTVTFDPIISQAIEEMKAEMGNKFSLERINLAELERRTGVTRAKLRRLKKMGFKENPHAQQLRGLFGRWRTLLLEALLQRRRMLYRYFRCRGRQRKKQIFRK